MKKFLVIFFFISIFIPKSAGAFYFEKNVNCNQYDGGLLSACLAIENNDHGFCYKNNLNKQEENECLADYVYNKKDLSLCYSLLSESTRKNLTLENLYPQAEKLGICLTKFAIEKNNDNICNRTSMDSICLGEFAVQTGDYNFCLKSRNIYDGIPENVCFTHVAIRKDSLALCEEIINPDYEIAQAEKNKESCLAAFAVKRNDPGLCEGMSDKSYCLDQIATKRRADGVVANQSVLFFFEQAFKWWGRIAVILFVLLVGIFWKKSHLYFLPIFLILVAPLLAFARVIFKTKDYVNLPIAGGDANLHSFVLLIYSVLVIISLIIFLKSGYNCWVNKDGRYLEFKKVFYASLFIFVWLLGFITGFNPVFVDSLRYSSGMAVIWSNLHPISAIFSGSYLFFFAGLVMLFYAVKSFKKRKILNLEKNYISLVAALIFIILGLSSAFFTVAFWFTGEISM